MLERVRIAALAVLVVLPLLPAAAQASDQFSVQVSLERNDLLRERIALQRELKELDEEIGESEKRLTVTGTVGSARMVHNLHEEHADGLRRRRNTLLDRIDGVDRRFETLTRRVVAHYGEQPGWWSDIK
jgi:hypothetical protein